MAYFHVFIRGEHFLIEQDGKQSWMGFYKNVYVDASDADEASSIAVTRACADPDFRAAVKNPPTEPPAMNIDEVTEIEKDTALADSAFVYFPEEAVA
jgi:hypothetical protein